MSAAEETVIDAAPAEVPVEVRTQVADVINEAGRELVVQTEDDYRVAGEHLVALAARKKELDAKRRELVDPLNATVKRINDWFRDPIARCDEGRGRIERGMSAFRAEQRRIEEERQRVAAEAARKERERLEREAAAAEEKARKERERAEEKARLLEEQGKAERAEAAREAAERRERERLEAAERQRAAAAMVPAAPVVTAAPVKAQGVSTRKVWDFEVVDVAKLPAKFLIADEKKIRKVVGALGADTEIPGVRVFEREVTAVRTK